MSEIFLKTMTLLLSVSILMLSACSAKVTTYDANGQITGMCKAERGFMNNASAGCSGFANPKVSSR